MRPTSRSRVSLWAYDVALMPLFIDVHEGLGDATPEDIAAAHAREIATQDEFGVRYLTYWYNGRAGKSMVRLPSHLSFSALRRQESSRKQFAQRLRYSWKLG